MAKKLSISKVGYVENILDTMKRIQKLELSKQKYMPTDKKVRITVEET